MSRHDTSTKKCRAKSIIYVRLQEGDYWAETTSSLSPIREPLKVSKKKQQRGEQIWLELEP